MKNYFSWQGSVLTIGKYKTQFIYPIRQAEEFNNKVIVLLEIPANDNTINNLYAVGKNGKILWQSQNINHVYKNQILLPYEQMIIDNKGIRASDFYGRQYYIDGDTGRIIKREIIG